MQRLDSLNAWTVARTVSRKVYLISSQPALKHHLALIDQIRRSALSIPANIAEGYALGSTAQFMRHLRIALGSATELQTHLSLIDDLSLGEPAETKEALKLNNKLIGLVIGLLRSLAHRKQSPFAHPSSPVPLKSKHR